MGRITVYSADDLNSSAAKLALKARKLPFLEINLERYPQKSSDLMALSGTLAVPQVFFNTRLVGDLKSVLQELATWDSSTKYKTPKERYEKEIERFPDPINLHLAKPDTEPVPARELPVRMPSSHIKLPDGTSTTVHDITQKLFNSLPRFEAKVNKTVYANCFSGEDLVKAFQESMELSPEEADSFRKDLVEARVIHHLGSSQRFAGGTNNEIYRLQCLMAPDVINSFCFWIAPVQNDIVKVVEILMLALFKLERDALVASETRYKIDHEKAKASDLYYPLQEAICELQESTLDGLSHETMMATCLNIYWLMLRFAFIKVGIPEQEDIAAYLSSVKFKVQGQVYSFRDWIDGVFRGNKKSSISNKQPFGGKDPRKKVMMEDFDNRLHFAFNCGFILGSKSSLPFVMFTADKIDDQLNIASQVFLDDDNNLTIRDGDIFLNEVVEWYRSDFPSQDTEFMVTLMGLMSARKCTATQQVLLNGPVKLHYMKPNWKTCAKNFDVFDKQYVSDVSGFRGILKRFKAPQFSINEAKRLQTLTNLNVLDTLPEERFDRITRMVQTELDVPIVLVSLVDQDRQWFKSNQWNCDLQKPSETGRDISFCGHAILGERHELFVISDAAKDDRFGDNPLVTGDLNLRFYAGCPLDIPSADGDTVNIGTLCLIDRKPRELTDADKEKLVKYADLVKDELMRRDAVEAATEVSTIDGET